MIQIPNSHYGANDTHYEFTEEEKERFIELLNEIQGILCAGGYSVNMELSNTKPFIDWQINFYGAINPDTPAWSL